MKSDFKIAVIGLGMIGGSAAFALKGFKNAYIAGCDINADTRFLAEKSGAADEVCADAGDAIDGADVIIFCTYPDLIGRLIEDNRKRFKHGAVISDVCGVKRTVVRDICRVLPDGVDYVGGHPMAGKEVEGFENASPELFRGCGFIITPIDSSRPENIRLIEEMARYMGAEKLAMATPEEHDRVIAYTSDLMHIAASALCLSYPDEMSLAYTAGAFRDCTRIARINPELWSELFLLNRENVVSEADRLIENVENFRDAIAKNDRERLKKLLATVKDNKIEMQNRS